MFFRLAKQMAECEGVTEKLKADDQMEWVGRMNNIRSRAKDVINNELIFSQKINGSVNIKRVYSTVFAYAFSV